MASDDGNPHGDRRVVILHLEDSPLDADLALARLQHDGLSVDVHRVESREAFEAALRMMSPLDAILSDYRLPAFDGMTALSLSRQYRPDVPFIFLSGVLGEENAIESLKLGATDYVLKQRMERLVPSLRRALAESQERSRRELAERRLDRSRAQLRFTLDAVRIGHWELDVASRQVRARSAHHDRIFGYEPSEQGWGVAQFLTHVHPDDREAVEQAMQGVLGPEGSCEFECRIIRTDGQERWIWVKGAFQPDADGVADDAPRVAAGLVMDVTERKLAEQERERLLRSEREARSEAERASRLKDDFLATLSHELRTPLNAVLGWAQLMRRGAVPPEEVPATMEVIERNARLQSQLVEDLLDMSRITSGKVRLDTQQTDMASVVRAAVAAVRPSADARRLILREQYAAEPIVVIGDPSRLQQVIWNLLSNAVKFTPGEGSVTVSLSSVCGWAEVQVTDSGQGIDPEFLPHVFDRFRQQDSSIARRHGGLGVGLSIVRSLVELHGGEVMAESQGLGKGATFIVRLRQETDGSGAFGDGDHHRLAPPSLAGLKVLVVEDEDDAREYFRRVLLDCGAQVLSSSRAAEGMKLIKSELPDLLLSDLGMPEQDGYDFIRQVRRLPEHEGGNIPAIAVTAYARPEDRQRSLSAGFQAHIAKPVDAAKLLEAISTLLVLSRAGGGDAR